MTNTYQEFIDGLDDISLSAQDELIEIVRRGKHYDEVAARNAISSVAAGLRAQAAELEKLAATAQWLLPPEDREHGFECLAFHRGKWTHVKWMSQHRSWSLGYAQPMILDAERAFAPLPAGTETDFFGWK